MKMALAEVKNFSVLKILVLFVNGKNLATTITKIKVIEYTPKALTDNLKALDSVLEIGKGTDKKPYDKDNELSVKIAKSEIDFIRWLGKVWGR